jgi:hypothetical protein
MTVMEEFEAPELIDTADDPEAIGLYLRFEDSETWYWHVELDGDHPDEPSRYSDILTKIVVVYEDEVEMPLLNALALLWEAKEALVGQLVGQTRIGGGREHRIPGAKMDVDDEIRRRAMGG